MSHKERVEKIHRLNELFDSQIKTLTDLGCPEKVIDILNWQRDKVVVACLRIRILPNRIPFIPVITPAYCKVEELMAMVRNGKKNGEVYPQIMEGEYPIIDAVGSQPFLRTYFDPYYAINVEDGTLTKGMDARMAYKKIISSGGSPLNTPEGISLCILTDVLSKHFLWMMGSRWESEDKIPKITLTIFGGDPQLYWEHIDNCCEALWATPSCGGRVG